MMSLKIKKIIKKFQKTTVDQNWLESSRERMINFMKLNPVKKTYASRQTMPEVIFNKLILRPMPIAIIALIIGLAAGSGVVAAAQTSLPTDALYPVKIAAEQIQEAMTFNNAKKIDLSVKLAEKRLDEVKRLEKQGQASTAVIEKTLASYEKHLANAQNQLTDVNGNNVTTKVIAAAVKYENSLEKQQEKLAALTSQASAESQPSLVKAQKENIANSNQVLKKIEIKIQETETSQADTSASKGFSRDKIEVLSPTTMEKIPEYIPDIDKKTKNRIKTAENKLAEIRKKIDNFSGRDENKCGLIEKEAYLEKLETSYQKMQTALAEAQKLFGQKNYLTALNQANYAMASAIDIDNLAGQWRGGCGDNNEPANRNECKAVFSNCGCAYKCIEIIERQGLTDCARHCSPDETNNYQPSCGYKNGACQNLNEANACPLPTPNPPNWCKNGKIYPGEADSSGCHGPPRCIQKKVESDEPSKSSQTGQDEDGQKEVESSQSSETTRSSQGENNIFESIFKKFLQIK